mmetsp:Transcript_33668/g.66537  ORF Transcript_33668/g.66537 Transcript_33668/m.66537 type:complete len:203 (-) Transcript_33668:713-1321(-)
MPSVPEKRELSDNAPAPNVLPIAPVRWHDVPVAVEELTGVEPAIGDREGTGSPLQQNTNVNRVRPLSLLRYKLTGRAHLDPSRDRNSEGSAAALPRGAADRSLREKAQAQGRGVAGHDLGGHVGPVTNACGQGLQPEHETAAGNRHWRMRQRKRRRAVRRIQIIDVSRDEVEEEYLVHAEIILRDRDKERAELVVQVFHPLC